MEMNVRIRLLNDFHQYAAWLIVEGDEQDESRKLEEQKTGGEFYSKGARRDDS
jgi:hypothetical protein